MLFIDRFNRSKISTNGRIGYMGTPGIRVCNRELLPAVFWNSGYIEWFNSEGNTHNSKYPARTHINGEMVYFYHGHKITAFESLIISSEE